VRELQKGCPTNSILRYDLEHIFHATWEGQHAAMRWLIEFAGVEARKGSNIITIAQFDDGAPIDSSNEHYKELKDVWTICSEITSHPTERKRKPGDNEKNPIRLTEPRLHNAARILRDHFRKIYKAIGVPLGE